MIIKTDFVRSEVPDHAARDVHRAGDDEAARKNAATLGTSEKDPAGSDEDETRAAATERSQSDDGNERLIGKKTRASS